MSMLNKNSYTKIDLKSFNFKRADLMGLRNKGIIDLKIETKHNLNKKTVEFIRIKDYKRAEELLNNKRLKQQKML
ncbi:hypothetical protein PL321_17280 [Caloramator sp. mosi_1]|uniref:hypothetical protein n=1 Tax=Caloramator sp. mosi_1 TaxID=3023090 RepID=UPI00236294FA|nr:hypothetical protein [Caloramator sp. mosi_1]WDC84054.1 hypothetical protein PL321_17280 [Caloramator sp. mosi_1]